MNQSNWRFALRVVVKAALLFVLINVLFALLRPLDALGRLSLYNTAIPGRDRLPYGENPAQSYNLSLFNIPAMFASHEVSQTKADDEFRVLMLGDSATWGWYLKHDETFTAYLNAQNLTTDDGRRIVIYNLGYPIMSLTKDLMLLDYALRYEPDMILWSVTLESFSREQQLFPQIVLNNPHRIRPLIEQYDLALNPQDSRFIEQPTLQESLIEPTLIGQRRALADLLRLQFYGFSWGATEIDQFIPAEFARTSNDFDEDISWQEFDSPQTLTRDDLAFDVLQAGIQSAGETPVLLINEPMFIADGENSDLHYNAFYPRWAYDTYHDLLLATAQANDWPLLDLWDALPPSEFTDSPVHTTAIGAQQVAELMAPFMQESANRGSP